MLIGRDDGARRLAALRVGSRARVSWWLEDPARTGISADEDTGRVLMLVVDGRQSFSRGATMVELALLLAELGAESALNLDVGGSSTMVARRPDGVTTVVNSPSDGRQRLIPNGLGVTYRRR